MSSRTSPARTDLIEAPQLSQGCRLYLKTENLQVTGSFKVRGAYYKISQLSEAERAKGVIACSAGNHAQGVALAATRMGIRSIVCMPDGAPIMKVENTKSLGAEVCLVPGTYDDAHDYAVQLQSETGMTFIHPYDDELVIAGQGTIGLEILDQLPDLDAVIVPVGRRRPDLGHRLYHQEPAPGRQGLRRPGGGGAQHGAFDAEPPIPDPGGRLHLCRRHPGQDPPARSPTRCAKRTWTA